MATSRRTGTNENISTFGNATRDYTVLSSWESDTDNALSSLNQSEVLECYADSSSYTVTAEVTFGGATTNASYFRIVRPASGHSHGGIPGQGVLFTTSSNMSFWTVGEAYFSTQDIEVGSYSLLQSANRNVFRSDYSYTDFTGCIAHDILNTSSGSTAAISAFISVANNYIHAINCLASDIRSTGAGNSMGFRNYSGTLYCYNCTAVNCEQGFNVNSTMYRKNCLADGNDDDVYGSPNDTTCYDSGDNGRGSYSLTYESSNQDDFHIVEADRTTMGAGTDLSADGVFPFDDDIDGDSRSSWDIGFDEYVGGGGGGPTIPVLAYHYNRHVF